MFPVLLAEDLALETDASEIFMFVIVVLFIGVAIKYVFERRLGWDLPYTSLLLVATVLLGLSQRGNSDIADSSKQMSNMNPLLLQYIFMPILMLEAAFEINYRNFKRLFPVIMILLVPGVTITALLSAVLVYYGFSEYEWDWITCLILGAILCATDTLHVVGVMRKAGVAERLSAIIEGESVMVDCTSFILVSLFVNIAISTNSTSINHPPGEVVVENELIIHEEVGAFFQDALGGPLWGYALGLVTVFFLYRVVNDPSIEIATSIVMSYVAYVAGSHYLVVNGNLASLAYGLYLSNWARHTISPAVLPSLHNVIGALSYFCNTIIYGISGVMISFFMFVSDGAQVCPAPLDRAVCEADNSKYVLVPIGGTDVGYCFLLYIFLMATRGLAAVMLMPVIRFCGFKLNWKDAALISWSGIRGSQSLTLTLTVILNANYQQVVTQRLAFQACGIVLLTNLINAPTAAWFVRMLRLKSDSPEARLVLKATIDQMKREGDDAIVGMKENKDFEAAKFDEVDEVLQSLCADAVKSYSSTHGGVSVMDKSRSAIGKYMEEMKSMVNRAVGKAVTASNATSTRNVLMSPSARVALSSDAYEASSNGHSDADPSASESLPSPANDASVNAIETGTIRAGGVELAEPAVSQHRQREALAERFLELQRTEYHRLYDTGALSRAATITLMRSIDSSLDRRDLGEQWRVIEAALQVPFWLSWLYQSQKARTFPWINQFIHRQVFLHFALSVEVSSAFCRAFEKLGEFLEAYPVLRQVNREAMEEIEREASVYNARTVAAYQDIRSAFPEVYTAVHSRRACLTVLKSEDDTLLRLHESGLLSALEYESLNEQVDGAYIELKRSRMVNELPSTDSILLSQEYSRHLQPMQQDWLVARGHRLLVTPNTFLTNNQASNRTISSNKLDAYLKTYITLPNEPGIYVVARGQVGIYFKSPAAASNEQSNTAATVRSSGVLEDDGDGVQQRVGPGYVCGARSLVGESADTLKTITTCELFFFPLSALERPMNTDSRFAACMVRAIADEMLKSTFSKYAPFDTMIPSQISALVRQATYLTNEGESNDSVDKVNLRPGTRVLIVMGHCDLSSQGAAAQAVSSPAFFTVTRALQMRSSDDARWLVWSDRDEQDISSQPRPEQSEERIAQVLTAADHPWARAGHAVPAVAEAPLKSNREEDEEDGVELQTRG